MAYNHFSSYRYIIDKPKYLSFKFIFHGTGVLVWTYVGFLIKDKAILTNFGLQIPLFVVGFFNLSRNNLH